MRLTMGLLDLVPMWFRCHWPLKRYYWQADEIARIQVEAERFKRLFNASILLVLLLAGCATGATAPRTDTISFDRAQFAFMLAEVGQLISVKCRDPKADKVECARLSEQYQAVRKQVMTPPAPSVAPAGSGIDIEMLLKLLGVFVGAAT